MRLSAKESVPVPWKNGGGTTRELSHRSELGQMIWRLSLADISRDGPFSAFPRLCRIHTIVTGRGLSLVGGGVTFLAKPFQPLMFDGALQLDAELVDGACQAFNVIYNPDLVQAEAEVSSAGPIRTEKGENVLFVLTGELDLGALGRLTRHEGLILKDPASGQVSDGGMVLQICFAPV